MIVEQIHEGSPVWTTLCKLAWGHPELTRLPWLLILLRRYSLLWTLLLLRLLLLGSLLLMAITIAVAISLMLAFLLNDNILLIGLFYLDLRRLRLWLLALLLLLFSLSPLLDP